jgi:hypothetical protein
VRGYLGQQDSRLQFGVGKAESVDIEIRWPGGAVETHKNVPTNQMVVYLREARAK